MYRGAGGGRFVALQRLEGEGEDPMRHTRRRQVMAAISGLTLIALLAGPAATVAARRPEVRICAVRRGGSSTA